MTPKPQRAEMTREEIEQKLRNLSVDIFNLTNKFDLQQNLFSRLDEMCKHYNDACNSFADCAIENISLREEIEKLKERLELFKEK